MLEEISDGVTPSQEKYLFTSYPIHRLYLSLILLPANIVLIISQWGFVSEIKGVYCNLKYNNTNNNTLHL